MTQKKNLYSIGAFRCVNYICESMIKAFGGIFVYKTSGQLSYVFYYIMVYSAAQILCNLLFNKLFAKYPKISLILRLIPYGAMFSLFFFNLSPLVFMLLISITNGATNSFYACPIIALNGGIKEASKPKYQAIVQTLEYAGIIIASVLSSFFLDKFDAKWVALTGMGIYLLLTILFFFFYKTTVGNRQSVTENDLIQMKPENKIATEKSFIDKIKEFNPFKNFYGWLSEACVGIITTLDVLITVYAYIIFGSFFSAGIINAVIACCAFVGSMVIGLVSSKYNWRWLGYVSVAIDCACVVAMSFINIFWLYIVLAGVFAFMKSFHIVPLDSAYFENSDKYKNKSQVLAQKDTYRKLTSIPLGAICLAFSGIGGVLLFVGISKLLTLIPIYPGSKDYNKQNINVK